MALVKCPECGREKVSDTAVACPDCGYAIKEYYDKLKYEEEQKLIQEKLAREEEERKKQALIEVKRQEEKERIEREETEKKVIQLKKERKIRNKKIAIAIGILLIAGTIGAMIKNVIIPSSQYVKASELMKEEKYEEAKVIYEELGTYKEAVEKAKKCKLGIVENNVNKESELKESLEYLNSIEMTDEVRFIKNNCLLKLIQNEYINQNYSEALIYLNEIEVTDEIKAIKNDCFFNLALKEYEARNYRQAIEYFVRIDDLNSVGEDKGNANDILQESLKNYGMSLYDKGDFNATLIYMERIENKDDMINGYIKNAKFLNSLQGKWYSIGSGSESFEFDGWVMIHKDFDDKDKAKELSSNTYNMKSMNIVDDTLVRDDKEFSTCFSIQNSLLKLSYANVGRYTFLENAELFFELLEQYPTSPCLGMTAEEVRASSWGKPENINKSTYSWGTKEQWCYSGYRYIYLENGIVTSISE